MAEINNLAKWSNDESSNCEKDYGTTCIICKIRWIELKEKCGEWVQCDIWDEYICPKCFEKKDIFKENDFFVVFELDHKY